LADVRLRAAKYKFMPITPHVLVAPRGGGIGMMRQALVSGSNSSIQVTVPHSGQPDATD